MAVALARTIPWRSHDTNRLTRFTPVISNKLNPTKKQLPPGRSLRRWSEPLLHYTRIRETRKRLLTLAQPAVDKRQLCRVRLGQDTESDAYHLKVLRPSERLLVMKERVVAQERRFRTRARVSKALIHQQKRFRTKAMKLHYDTWVQKNVPARWSHRSLYKQHRMI